MSEKSLLTLYYSMIHCHLIYGLNIWSFANTTNYIWSNKHYKQASSKHSGQIYYYLIGSSMFGKLSILKIFVIKGSVSRDLRWVLLYTNRNLSLRPFIGSQKILSLLKGYFTIYVKQAGAPLYYDMVLSRQYWKRR